MGWGPSGVGEDALQLLRAGLADAQFGLQSAKGCGAAGLGAGGLVDGAGRGDQGSLGCVRIRERIRCIRPRGEVGRPDVVGGCFR